LPEIRIGQKRTGRQKEGKEINYIANASGRERFFTKQTFPAGWIVVRK
jgi:hypothetical protein